MTKKELKKNIKHTKNIESMLLDILTNSILSEEDMHLVVKELLAAGDFIGRFKTCLKEMEAK
tara:strand:+ start:1003 stop:1188 length:186 start_codon:yes stop_codon:yes gene_type:complete